MATAPLIDESHVWRTFDVAAVNDFVNHPAVLPSLSLGIYEQIDMSPLLQNDRNICFIGQHGGAICVWSGPGIYDCHNFVVPEGRGGWAKRAMSEIIVKMFRDFGAAMLWAQTPIENAACRFMNRALGFQSRGKEMAILAPGLSPQLVEVFSMEGIPCQ